MDPPPQTRYAVIVRLPERVEALIEAAFVDAPGMTRPTMGYHITMVGPFFVALGVAVGEIEEATAAVCAAWQPFRVHIAGLGAFRRPDNNVVYLGVPAADELTALHQRLTQAIEGRIVPQYQWCDEDGFVCYQPHVTLGLGLTDAELIAALQTEAHTGLKATFTVASLQLTEQQPGGPWRCVSECTMGVEAFGPGPCSPPER
ncbi:MAG: 2'-5' RNA ligase family protein [Chloroflexi bacterium]|nr:2'-5' RNA ligase family protein [Chloroflexota bacterium]